MPKLANIPNSQLCVTLKASTFSFNCLCAPCSLQRPIQSLSFFPFTRLRGKKSGNPMVHWRLKSVGGEFEGSFSSGSSRTPLMENINRNKCSCFSVHLFFVFFLGLGRVVLSQNETPMVYIVTLKQPPTLNYLVGLRKSDNDLSYVRRGKLTTRQNQWLVACSLLVLFQAIHVTNFLVFAISFHLQVLYCVNKMIDVVTPKMFFIITTFLLLPFDGFQVACIRILLRHTGRHTFSLSLSLPPLHVWFGCFDWSIKAITNATSWIWYAWQVLNFWIIFSLFLGGFVCVTVDK